MHWLIYNASQEICTLFLPIPSFVTSLVLGQSYDCPQTDEVTLVDNAHQINEHNDKTQLVKHNQQLFLYQYKI